MESWNLIRSLHSRSSHPWCILGDFNDLLVASDKHGRVPHPQCFKETISDCGLAEVDLVGGNFTSEKSRGTPNWIRERLDRAFGSAGWWTKFPLCKLSVLQAVVSDHSPLFLDFFSTTFSRSKFRFRFENTWLKEPTFHGEIAEFWKSIHVAHLLPKLDSISSFMAKWGHNFFHKFRDKIKKKEFLNMLVKCTNEASINEYLVERLNLEKLLEYEEFYWQQRAKKFWLSEGDSNTKFFTLVLRIGRKVVVYLFF